MGKSGAYSSRPLRRISVVAPEDGRTPLKTHRRFAFRSQAARVNHGASLTLRCTAGTVRCLSSDGLQEHVKSAADRLSHEGRFGRARAATAGEMAGRGAIRKNPGSPRRGRKVRAARWSALCQWGRSHRQCWEQNSQRFHCQIPEPARQKRALPARLGLPWAADRIQSDPGDAQSRQGQHRRGGDPHGVRSLCAQIHRSAARAVQTPGRAGRLGEPIFNTQ